MSFLASHQRGYDSLSHPDLPHHPPIHPANPPRIPMHALPSFDSLPPDSFSPVPSSSMVSIQSNPAHSSHIPDRPHISLPRVGETRCCEFVPICLAIVHRSNGPSEPCSVSMLTDRRDHHHRLDPPHLRLDFSLPRPRPRKPPRRAGRLAHRQAPLSLRSSRRASVSKGRSRSGTGEPDIARECDAVSATLCGGGGFFLTQPSWPASAILVCRASADT